MDVDFIFVELFMENGIFLMKIASNAGIFL